ncbi:MAG TPA: hypothetical protein VEZ50_11945 [Nodosilinea sp.]|nr:hypothetical protein [Nodosilinea sp.]
MADLKDGRATNRDRSHPDQLMAKAIAPNPAALTAHANRFRR